MVFGHPAAASGPAPPPSAPQVLHTRIGIGAQSWVGINPNDAKAAISAWARTILQQRGIVVDVQTRIFDSQGALAAAMENDELDSATLSTEDFLALDPRFLPESIFIATRSVALSENYVLLTHRSSEIRSATDLPGKRLLIQAGSHAGLIRAWLDVLSTRPLPESGDEALRTDSPIDKPSRALLPVFFRQADACVVTSNSWATAGELNPQLRRDLRLVAMSPDLVPGLFFFHPHFQSSIRDALESAVMGLHETPAGLQVLTVFQANRMVKQPLSSLDTTRELLAERRRLRPPDPARAARP